MRKAVIFAAFFFWLQPLTCQEFNWSQQEKVTASKNAFLLQAESYDSTGMLIWIDPSLGMIRSSTWDRKFRKWAEAANVAPYTQKIVDSSFCSLKSGGAFFVWIEENKDSLLISKFNPQKNGWCYSQLFTPSKKQFEKVNSLSFSQGGAAIVWECSEGKESRIEIIIYDANSMRWSSPLLLSPQMAKCTSPQLIEDSNGNIHVIWSQINGSHSTIFSSRFDAEKKQWTQPVMISSSWNQFAFSSSQIACDTTGNVYVVWACTKGNDPVGMIQLSRFDCQKKSWLLPRQLSHDHFNRLPKITCNSLGHVMVGWENDYREKTSLQALIYRSDEERWDEVQQVAQFEAPLDHILLKADGADNFHLAGSSGNQIFISKFDLLDMKWLPLETAATIEKSPSSLSMLLDEVGNAQLFLESEHEVFSIYGNYLLPPQKITGYRYRSRLPTRSYIAITLNWNPSTSPNIKGYCIREGARILATTPQTSYTHKIPKEEKKAFSITTINTKNRESFPSEITIE